MIGWKVFLQVHAHMLPILRDNFRLFPTSFLLFVISTKLSLMAVAPSSLSSGAYRLAARDRTPRGRGTGLSWMGGGGAGVSGGGIGGSGGRGSQGKFNSGGRGRHVRSFTR